MVSLYKLIAKVLANKLKKVMRIKLKCFCGGDIDLDAFLIAVENHGIFSIYFFIYLLPFVYIILLPFSLYFPSFYPLFVSFLFHSFVYI